MSKNRPEPWRYNHAPSVLSELPRNGALLISKALGFAADLEGSSSAVASGGRRGVTPAVPNARPSRYASVEVGLKRAEAALAVAKAAERQAWLEAQDARARADIAGSIGDEGEQRMRQATDEAQREVDRRTQQARDRLEQLVERERQKASRDVAAWLEQVMVEIETQLGRARKSAEEADARARRQLASAQALAAEATAAAREVADQAHRQAGVGADEAEQRARSADQVVSDARGIEQVLARDAARAVQADEEFDVPNGLTKHTKAELLDIARPLQVQAAARMTKDQLVTAIRDASRPYSR